MYMIIIPMYIIIHTYYKHGEANMSSYLAVTVFTLKIKLTAKSPKCKEIGELSGLEPHQPHLI